MKRVLLICFLVIGLSVHAQTGVIKGSVVDKQSEYPLLGVTIELLNATNPTGTITSEDGYYRLENVPLGRQTIRISYLGFETLTIPNIVVTSGKDVVVDAAMTENFDQLDEVVIVAGPKKDQAINKMSTVSARQFGLEEVTRFSGGRGDVGRLAANYAGVSAPDDSRNDIVIRGNSPSGLLWRIEGIPISNPNHFSTFGSTGGPVSAVNSNILKDSDFITSAFPSEYGNAIGGVFDLGMRKGNADNSEYTIQAGIFTGVEATAEGPMGNNKGSFLVAGRYSLASIVGAGAAGASTATPDYWDVAFNLDFGKGKMGSLSLFGIIGFSNINFFGDSIDENDLFAAEDEDLFVKSKFGVVGLKHQIAMGENSYLKTVLAGSFTDGDVTSDRYLNKNTPQERTIEYTRAVNNEARWSVSTLFNSKVNNKTTLRTGVLLENYDITSLLKNRRAGVDTDQDGDPDYFTFMDINEGFSILQPFAQGRFRLTEKFTLNAGLHSQYSSLNEQFVIEPRAGLQFAISQNHKLSLGYGMHHQSVSYPILFLNEEVNGALERTNIDLDFVKSNHYVLGYDVNLAKNWRGKIEIYQQDISGAAVESFPSSYSSLIEGAGFGFDPERVSLVNEGTGQNKGIELTLEKFFSKGYYGLLTGSIFESKYTGSDGQENNTPFNNGYVLNFLTGREFAVGKAKRNVLFFDTRLVFSGGRFYTPINLQASQAAGFEVLQDDMAFDRQYDSYFRWDLKLGIKLNSDSKKSSHQLYFDFQNVTNNENVFVRNYNRLTNEINQINQIGFFPDFGYRFQF